MKSGTVIYDIKPYIPYADSVPDAAGSFAQAHARDRLRVDFPQELQALIPAEKLPALIESLSEDPRPQYHDDPERIYGFLYADRDVRFRVRDGALWVVEIVEGP